jgi:hypothetical protein
MEVEAPKGFRWRLFQIEGQSIFAYFLMHYWCRASLPSTRSVGLGVLEERCGRLGEEHWQQRGDGAAAMAQGEFGFEV